MTLLDNGTLLPGSASETEARVAVEGDTVTVQYKCMNSKGEVSESLCTAFLSGLQTLQSIIQR